MWKIPWIYFIERKNFTKTTTICNFYLLVCVNISKCHCEYEYATEWEKTHNVKLNWKRYTCWKRWCAPIKHLMIQNRNVLKKIHSNFPLQTIELASISFKFFGENNEVLMGKNHVKLSIWNLMRKSAFIFCIFVENPCNYFHCFQSKSRRKITGA